MVPGLEPGAGAGRRSISLRPSGAGSARASPSRGLCRWNEVTRRIELWISILELNELGEYAAVELHQAKDVNTGGVFQLRQVPACPAPLCLCAHHP